MPISSIPKTSPSPSPPPPPPPVVIVGAGLAGLSAARTLSRLFRSSSFSSKPSVLLLEAQERVGGRVHTLNPLAPTTSSAIEFGATFFHGTVGNVVFDFARAHNLIELSEAQKQKELVDEEHDEFDDGSAMFTVPGVMFHANGTTTTNIRPDDMRRVSSLYDDTMAYVEKTGIGESAGAVIAEKINEQLGPDLNSIQKGVWHARELFECAVNGCSSTSQLSAQRFSDYVTLRGDNVRMTNGYGMSNVVDAMYKEVQSMDNVSVLTCAQVTRIYDDESLYIHFKTNDNSIHVQRACALIWTPSIAVTLHANKTALFNPPLPVSKIKAFERRGFGDVEQVHAFLSPSSSPSTTTNDGDEYHMTPVLWEQVNVSDWRTGVFGVVRRQNVISLWLVGPWARAFARISSSEEQCTQIQTFVRQALQDNTLEIEHVEASDWFRNPYIRGAYSYPGVCSQREDLDEIGKPIELQEKNGLLCFAGEATHPKFYSTMHGAMESGMREAKRVAEYVLRVE